MQKDKGYDFLTFLGFLITFFLTKKTPLAINVWCSCPRGVFSFWCIVQELLKRNGKKTTDEILMKHSNPELLYIANDLINDQRHQ